MDVVTHEKDDFVTEFLGKLKPVLGLRAPEEWQDVGILALNIEAFSGAVLSFDPLLDIGLAWSLLVWIVDCDIVQLLIPLVTPSILSN